MTNYADITDDASKFDGVIVVGDIHGNWSEFEIVVDRVIRENLYLISLGDVMDYGFENVKCFEALNSLIEKGQATMLIGNHEFKLFKYINQSREKNIRIKLLGGIKTTIEEFENMDRDELTIFEDKFLEAYRNSTYIVSCGNYFFTHGAVDPMFWDQNQFAKATKSMAMFGQVDNKALPRDDGYPVRRYDWVNYIPSGKTVVVGHDIRDKSAPFHQHGRNGGKAIFLDTGSSKGGQLSTMTLSS